MENKTTIQYLQEVVEDITYLAIDPEEPLVVDSLFAAQLKWRVDLDKGVDVPLAEYFKGATLRDLAALIDTAPVARISE